MSNSTGRRPNKQLTSPTPFRGAVCTIQMLPIRTRAKGFALLLYKWAEDTARLKISSLKPVLFSSRRRLGGRIIEAISS